MLDAVSSDKSEIEYQQHILRTIDIREFLPLPMLVRKGKIWGLLADKQPLHSLLLGMAHPDYFCDLALGCAGLSVT
jgi:hypothetical protein